MNYKKNILVVDDTLTSLNMIEQILKEKYVISLASSGMQAIQMLESKIPDLILLDIKMPVMDGFETFKWIHKNKRTANIPIIMMGMETNDDYEAISLELGAVDFIRKPIQRLIITKRIDNQLRLSDEMSKIEKIIKNKTMEFENLQDMFSVGFAEIVESRDGTTGGHIKNTTKYFEIFVNAISRDNKYKATMTSEYVRNLVRAAPLHDIGKIGINDSILLKGESLSKEEFEQMKKHTIIGGEVLQNVLEGIKDVDFLSIAKDMALFHHERWDGTGYSLGLSGEDIPLCARILSIVDVYDALTAKRPYKEPFSHDNAIKIILDGSGTFFDPSLIDIFIKIEDNVFKCYIQREEGPITILKDIDE